MGMMRVFIRWNETYQMISQLIISCWFGSWEYFNDSPWMKIFPSFGWRIGFNSKRYFVSRTMNQKLAGILAFRIRRRRTGGGNHMNKFQSTWFKIRKCYLWFDAIKMHNCQILTNVFLMTRQLRYFGFGIKTRSQENAFWDPWAYCTATR